jgi:Fur family ferric uptake transcriptional regulator
MSENDDLLAALRRALSERGHRLTPAREAILRALADSGGHVTADALAALVRHDAPRVGRMTVYRTLDLLCALALMRPVYQGTGAAHFILLDKGHHHHLVCSRCERIIEFDDCVVDELTQAIGRRFGFAIEGHLLEFYGRCADCRD